VEELFHTWHSKGRNISIICRETDNAAFVCAKLFYTGGTHVQSKIVSREGFGILRLVLISAAVLFAAFLIKESYGASDPAYTITRRDFIFDTDFVDAKTGIAVGNKGLIIRTADGGVTWAKINSGTFYGLNAVVLGEKEGWIVGQKGHVFRSQDGGNTWVRQLISNDASFMDILFPDGTCGIIAGSGGTILRTDDGGNSWGPVDLDWLSVLPGSLLEIGAIAPNLYSIFFIDPLHGWIAGDYGVVLYTANGGESWELLRAGNVPPLFSILFTDSTHGWAAGQNGLLLRTGDGGRSWNPVDHPVKASLHDIWFKGADGFVVGDQATILKTDTGGGSWTQVDLSIPPPYPSFSDITVVSNSAPVEIILSGSGLIRRILVPNALVEK